MLHLTNRIGNTPLLYLEHLSKILESNVYVKYEVCNPFGSIQDRTAWACIKIGIEDKKLTSGGSVIAASSGNFAVSLARLCASMHCLLYLAMPETKNMDLVKMLWQLGVVIKFTPAELGMLEAQNLAEYMYNDVWNSYFANQFKDADFINVHYESTGQEIVAQCRQYDIMPDLFVSGIGTGATITGVGKKLKEINPDIHIIGVEPAESPLLSGGKSQSHLLTGIGVNFIPPLLDRKLLSCVIPVCFEDALKATHRLLTKEGLSCGFTSGANLYTALLLARRSEHKGKNIIIMAHDGLERSLYQIKSN